MFRPPMCESPVHDHEFLKIFFFKFQFREAFTLECRKYKTAL